jgi:predicted glycogen debranching enzyme
LIVAGKAQRMLNGDKGPADVGKTVELLLDKELTRQRRLLKNVDNADDAVRRLTLAADKFIVSRGKKITVIAGYPWFTDWGRDTMIALPGLTLSTGRAGDARGILSTFAGYCRHGLLPNTFPDAGIEPSYNSVDATLWFFVAAHEYAAATGDTGFVDGELLPVFEDIIAHFERGTLYQIRVDGDGLVNAGGPGTQLTWMDARVDGVPVTPRYGKVVEINCLWYNALRITADCMRRAGRDAARIESLAARALESFGRAFWNPDRGCLFDVINDNGADPAARPNQVFALCLPYPLLEGEKAQSVLRAVEEKLLIPYGLRSLEPGHEGYRERYEGGAAERDGAYHQGTAWGWLLGPYVRAALRVRGGTPGARAALAPLAGAMRAHISTQAGLNSVSELFQAGAPHAPDGCFAQAWSVAEWLRALLLLQNSGD